MLYYGWFFFLFLFRRIRLLKTTMILAMMRAEISGINSELAGGGGVGVGVFVAVAIGVVGFGEGVGLGVWVRVGLGFVVGD